MLNENKRHRHDKNPNKVYLVGAGPGDPRLITLRGRELLEQADVVVYDRLASDLLLRYVREDAELIYAGKRPGEHSLTQDEINAMLIRMAREGKNVVRLKGGDPFIFGRGGEETLALAGEGIDFEIVPGVTAATGAGAYSGIPLTHREVSSSVAFITGHGAKGADGEPNWDTLARWDGTLVFYMSVSRMAEICDGLAAAGMRPDKPAVVIENCATSRQKIVHGGLNEIAGKAEAASIAPPALLIIGDVTKLNEQLAWFDKLSLFGKRILVTRPADQAEGMIKLILSIGGEPVVLPAIRSGPTPDAEPLISAIGRIAEYNFIVFTSRNGVCEFFRHLRTTGADARALAVCSIAAIGPQTAAQLRACGVSPDIIPKTYTTESLVEAMRGSGKLEGSRVLCPRSNIAPPDLIERLSDAGANVDEVVAYTVDAADFDRDKIASLLQKGGIDWLTFTSSSTAEYFFQSIDPRSVSGSGARVASIGPRTTQTLERLGLNVDIEAKEHTSAGIICGIIDFLSEG